MKVPLSEILSFLPLKKSVDEIKEALTLLGIEVDSVTYPLSCTGVVIAAVEAVSPHPEASKLQIAKVFDGKNHFQVVCGAANCRAGIKVPFAMVGADLGAVQIKKSAIRNVTSEGMLCAADEIGLPAWNDGILELPQDAPLGSDAAYYLSNPVFDLSFTPNLGHVQSALGIARELAAFYDLPLQLPSFGLDKALSPYKIHLANAYSYLGAHLSRVQIGPSPFWLQKILIESGLRPVSNGVDITQYILLKWGQPMHAFDAAKIDGKELFIEEAKEKTAMTTLDGVKRAVPPGVLLVKDRMHPLAIAGIIGGQESAITSSTTEIFLEAASFFPEKIKEGSKALSLTTESSSRFEKGVDPHLMPLAMQEAIHLFCELAHASLPTGIAEAFGPSFGPKKISFREDRCRQVIGHPLSTNEISSLFRRLGLHFDGKEVEVPFYRRDIGDEIDLIEEVARLYGYNHIERKAPLYRSSAIPHDPLFLAREAFRKRLLSLGLQECMTADLISPSFLHEVPEFDLPKNGVIKALHAKSEEYSLLRPSLLPTFLQIAKKNSAVQVKRLQIFELGHIYARGETNPQEMAAGAILLMGSREEPHFSSKPLPFDFFDLKGFLESLFASFHLPVHFVTSPLHPTLHPGRQMECFLQGIRVAVLGQVHPAITERMGVAEEIFFAEFDLDALGKEIQSHVAMKPLPLYPGTERDWTLKLPSGLSVGTFLSLLERPSLLESVHLIDRYEKGNEVHYTFRFIYRDPMKTLLFEEAEKAHAHIVEMAERKLLAFSERTS